MYEYFKTVHYPLKESSWNYFSAGQSDAIKSTIIDFGVNIYCPTLPVEGLIIGKPRAILKQIGSENNILRIKLEIMIVIDEIDFLLADGELLIEAEEGDQDFHPVDEKFIRVYFDNSDFNVPGSDVVINGFMCLDNYWQLLRDLDGEIFNTSGMEFEPTTINFFSRHRVNSITCKNSKPLIMQTESSAYQPAQEPVFGNIKLVPGNNCTVSVRPQTNTVIIGAVLNANDTPEEICGVWKDKISGPGSKDLLCSEVVCSVAGAKPDNFGNIEIQANTPLSVNVLLKTDLPAPFKAFINGSGLEFFPIIHYIYIGLPQSNENSSVFDCQTE